MANDIFTPSSQPCSTLNLHYDLWDEENFDNELGDCLYFSIFQPGADLEKGANKIAQFKKIISAKNINFSQDRVCDFLRIISLGENVCKLGKQVVATTNLTDKKQLEQQYTTLRDELLDNAPSMTHMRMGWDLDAAYLKSMREDAENFYPNDLEAQENYMGSLFGYKHMSL
jgi:hypothetical protein